RKEIRIIGDLPNIAFEMTVIDRVEANKGHKKSKICFKQRIAEKVSLPFEPDLQTVKRVEQGKDSLLVGLLRGGKSRPINAVIDRLVNQDIELVDFRSVTSGVKVESAVSEGVKFGIEYPHQIVVRIIHNYPLLFVPQDRHRKSALISRICCEVGL